MIALDQVSLFKPGVFRRDPLLLGATATFGSKERIGILATPGSGKSSLARLLSGIDQPDRGRIRTQGRISWPIGFAGFLHPSLTVQDNLKIFSRLMGMAPSFVIEFCEDFMERGRLRDKIMQELTPTERALLAYACALSVPGPATLIADEVISVGENHHRKKCDALLSEHLNESGLIFISRNTRQLKAYCNRFFVLLNKRLLPCENVDVAYEALEILKRNEMN